MFVPDFVTIAVYTLSLVVGFAANVHSCVAYIYRCIYVGPLLSLIFVIRVNACFRTRELLQRIHDHEETSKM